MNQNLKTDCAPLLIKTFLLAGFALLTVANLGCVEGRSSNHELDHQVPPHWPQSLSDAADKIEARLATMRSSGQGTTAARSELLEIVDWLPEVAADSALDESSWNEIYTACTRLKTLLGRSDSAASEAELQALCARFRELDQNQTDN